MAEAILHIPAGLASFDGSSGNCHEAIEQKQWKVAHAAISRVAQVLEKEAALINRATADLEKSHTTAARRERAQEAIREGLLDDRARGPSPVIPQLSSFATR